MSALSDWIKERRKALGLSQMQVASKLGMNQGQISHLENGKIMPDTDMMTKIDVVFGKFAGSYVPAQSAPGTKKMSEKAKEGLKAYRQAKENNFYLELDTNVYITADRNQYILKQGPNTCYFVELKSLLKYFLVSHMRQSDATSLQQICDKIDEIHALIDKRFDGYDPANVAASRIPDNIEDDAEYGESE